MTAVTAYYGELPFKSFGINATADWSSGGATGGNGSYQFRAVQLDASNVGNVIMPAGAGQAGFGVMTNAPRLNEAAQVVVMGETKVQLGATVTVGDQLMFDANGNFVDATSTHVVVAVARMSGVSGDVITALVNFMNFYPHA